MGPIAAGALGVATGIGAAFLSELTVPYAGKLPTAEETAATQQRGEAVATIVALAGAASYVTSPTQSARAFGAGLVAASAFSFAMYRRAERASLV